MGFATHLGPWLLGTVKNTTGTTAGTIRNMGATVVTQSVPITFNTTTAIQLAVLPAGAQIINIFFDVTTAFNANPGNLVNMATAGGTIIAQFGGSTVTPINVSRTVGSYLTSTGVWANVGTTDLITTVVYIPTSTTSAPTTGAGTVTIQYVVKGSDGSANPPLAQT